MKRLSILLLIITIILSFGACSKPKDMQKNNSSDVTNSNFAPTDVTKAELEKTYNDFSKLINSLDANEIEKIETNFHTPGGTFSNATTDKEIISQWVSFFKKMKFSAKPYEIYVGAGYSIDMYLNDKKEFIGNFCPPVIYVQNSKTMLYWENRIELAEEFENLKAKMENSSY